VAAALCCQGPDGRPLLLGPGRRLYSSGSGTDFHTAKGASGKGSSAAAVTMAAAAAGNVAKQLYSRVHKLPQSDVTPTWTTAPKDGGTGGDSGTMGQVGRQSGPGFKLGSGSSGQLGKRDGSDIVAEQVDAGVKGLAAMLGLGGFLALLGPAGEKLGIDHYGALMVMPDRKPLLGGLCGFLLHACTCVCCPLLACMYVGTRGHCRLIVHHVSYAALMQLSLCNRAKAAAVAALKE